jgi:hypothetical protein
MISKSSLIFVLAFLPAFSAFAEWPLTSDYSATGAVAGAHTFNANLSGAMDEVTFGDALASATVGLLPMTHVVMQGRVHGLTLARALTPSRSAGNRVPGRQ